MMGNKTTNNGGEDIYDILNGVSTYYGFDWYHTRYKSAILIYNGVEYFLIKHKGAKVKILLHQNHGRTGKPVSLPCSVEEIDNSIIQQYFHKQIWKDIDCTDMKRNLIYIYHHGNCRRAQDSKRRLYFQQLAFA